MRIIYYLSFLLLCVGLFPTPVAAGNDVEDHTPFATSPKREVRAVWLTTIGGLDWPHSYSQSAYSAEKQKDELRNILDSYVKAGINTVLIQTRIRGTVIYPSSYEPWDGCLSGFPGKSPGYDALQFAIEECHKRGMEIHAWVVTIPVGKWNAKGCKNLRQKFPGLIKRIGADGYMNPEDSRTSQYLADVCEEIVRNYDVDGIHLDYIRYPDNWKRRVNAVEGRQNITSIVQAIHDKVKALKPWVKMSCSPIGKYNDLSRYWSHGWNAYSRVYQDAQGWLKSGLMDELFPMMYFLGDQFYPFAIDWKEQSDGKIVAPGLGIYFLSPHEGKWQLDDVTREMYVLRQYGLGHAYFRGKFLTDNTKGIYSFAQWFDHAPALVPAMTWQNSATPESPTMVDANADRLAWKGSTPYYNIYSSRSWPVDTADPANLVAVRFKGQALNVDTRGRYFAVAGMDEYGNESTARQSHEESQSSSFSAPSLLPCDGERLQLPPKENTLDADMLIVESLQGNTVSSLPYLSESVSVRTLPNGIYVLKSINKKGITHRLGWFKIDRLRLSDW